MRINLPRVELELENKSDGQKHRHACVWSCLLIKAKAVHQDLNRGVPLTMYLVAVDKATLYGQSRLLVWG